MNRQIVFDEFNKGRVCVFHNEVIARSFAIEYALENGVIEADKAISYDTFREFFLPKHDNLTKVNTQMREFFLIDFLENNKLKYLICNEYPEAISRFTFYLVNIIKQLKEAIESDVFDSLEEDFKYDVNLLYEKYLIFLNNNNLFEPSYEKPSLEFAPQAILNNEYTIISADTKAGCKKFISQINNPDFIHLLNVEALNEEDSSFQNNCKLISFKNCDELQNTLFREVKKLLDSNILARDIAITLCSFDSDIQEIELGAKKFNIPISKAKGYSLSKYPGGKYLIYLSTLYDNNFALDDMKGFFLERAFPFEDIGFNRKLIRFAIDANIDHGSNKYEADYWIIRLQKEKELLDFYKKFKTIIIKINTLDNINDLQIALHSLEALLLKKDLGWKDTIGEKSYRYAIDKLDSISTSMKQCNISSIKQIFKQFIRLLENETYVEQGKRDGIRLFEYPLSASLDISFHFIVELNSKSSELIDKPLSLLPPSIEDLELRKEEDLTNTVIKDYCFNSGFTHFFYSEQNYDGAQIPPPFFMERNRIIKNPFTKSYKPYLDELSLWNGEKKDIKLTTYQAVTLNKAMKNILAFNDDGYVNNKIEKQVNEVLLEKIKNDQLLDFSATSINLFQNCPYAFAIKYLFKVDKKEYSVVPYAANEVGTIVHKIFEEFFYKVMSEDKQFYSGNKDKYIIWFNEIKDKQFNLYFEGEKSPPISTQIYILEKYKTLAQDFINVEIMKFDTCKSIEMEKKYISKEIVIIDNENYFYSLNGKIDRVVNLGNGTYAIVDYKTGHTPIGSTWYKKAYEEKRSSFPDYQFPCYKKLLAKQNMNVSNACYYSSLKGSYLDMWKEGFPENLADIDFTFDYVMKEMLIHILNGEFMATPSDDNCQNCSYRQVCRKRYSTK